VQVGILGPLVVWKGDGEVPITAPKQRAVLVLLLLRPGELVPTGALVDALWGERPPATAVKTVQVYVSQLRKLLGDGVVETRPAGYLIRLDPDALDAARFERLLARGRSLAAEGEPGEAAAALREALALWRGPALAEFRDLPFARDETFRLEELRLVALESRIEADVALGRHVEVVPELEALVREHPLRERLRELLMLALYRAGRQADALAVYQDARSTLVGELGLEPGQSIRDLEQAILRHDPRLGLAPVAARPPSGTVTMLFTDIEGSTRLVNQLGGRYGELLGDHRRLLREAFAAHGGREMDTQGDSFFAAFTRARDAAEAAVDAQRSLVANSWPDGVECRVRMGLHTGEPNVHDEGYHGHGLHRGARIAAAAHGGQIVLSGTTADLIREELPAGTTLRDLGEVRLKDLDRPERVYQLAVDGLPADFPPLRTASARGGRRGRVVALIAAAAIAAAGGAFLLTRGGGNDATATLVGVNSLAAFDADSGRLTGQVEVGPAPGAVAAGDGAMWVANTAANTVSRVDPDKGVTVETIPVGTSPAGIAFGFGFIWVANGFDGTVSKIDPRTNTVVDTITVEAAPAGVSVGRRYVWVANAGDHSVSRIDPQTDGVLPPIAVGDTANGIAAGGGSVWVTSQSSGQVTRIDERTGNVIGTVTAGSGANAVAVTPTGVWVANRLDSTVTDIDPETNGIRATVPVGDAPRGIAASAEAVWVSNEIGGSLSEIDPARDVVVQSVPTGNRPQGVVLSRSKLFVAVRASGLGHRGGTLRILGNSGIVNPDPASTYAPGDWQMLANTNDGLIGFRRTGGGEGAQLVPDLATALAQPTDNGRSYTFRLRPGIRYSTGALVQPQDIRRALERAIAVSHSGHAYGGGTYYDGIEGASACTKARCDLGRGIIVDPRDRSITFHLVKRDPDFLYKLALPYAYAVPADTPIAVHGPLPATGPYRIVSYMAKHGFRLERNPYFHEWSQIAQPDGYPDVIVRRADETPAADMTAVLAGKAGLADDQAPPPPSLLRQVQTQHADRLVFTPFPGDFVIHLNKSLPPFDDVRVRRAFNLAVDRARLIQLTGIPARVTCQPLPPNFEAFRRYCPYTVRPTSSGQWTGPDLTRARALVRQSGTVGASVTLVTPTYIPYAGPAARYAVSVLRSLGYNARYGGAVDYNKLMTTGKQIQAGFGGWSADYFSPTGFYQNILTCLAKRAPASNGAAVAGFCDPEIDREMVRAQALQASDPRRATLLWTKIDHEITDQAPWVAYMNPGWTQLLGEGVGNYQYHPQYGALLDQLWVR
jgi:peptide/nickel transport system substrate-binding protein